MKDQVGTSVSGERTPLLAACRKSSADDPESEETDAAADEKLNLMIRHQIQPCRSGSRRTDMTVIASYFRQDSKMQRRLLSLSVLFLAVVIFFPESGPGGNVVLAQEAASSSDSKDTAQDPTSVLTSAQWTAVDGAVDRALAFLTTRQVKDGSFAGVGTCQPAITSLAVMAFLSRGHLPGQGPYGDQLDKAVDFVLSTQSERGLLSYENAEPYLHQPPNPWEDARAHALYNHGISGVMLTELYGMIGDRRSEQIREAVVKALDFSRQHQTKYKKKTPRLWRMEIHVSLQWNRLGPLSDLVAVDVLPLGNQRRV